MGDRTSDLQLTRGQAAGTYDYWQGRSEIEYGLNDNVQLAGYLNTYAINSAKNYTNPDACTESVNPCTGGYGVSGIHNTDPSYTAKGIDGISLRSNLAYIKSIDFPSRSWSLF
jgi:hypothetical protein